MTRFCKWLPAGRGKVVISLPLFGGTHQFYFAYQSDGPLVLCHGRRRWLLPLQWRTRGALFIYLFPIACKRHFCRTFRWDSEIASSPVNPSTRGIAAQIYSSVPLVRASVQSRPFGSFWHSYCAWCKDQMPASGTCRASAWSTPIRWS